MANISLKQLLTEAEDFKARSKETGKLVHFKSKDSYDAAIKAGSHEDPDTKQDSSKEEPVKGASMFGADYAKNRGGEAPKANTTTSVPKITLPIQKKIQNWTEKEKAFFDKNEGAPGSKMRRSLGQTLKDKAAGALKAVKKGLKHEVDEFKAAGSAVNKFFRGDEISEHESKAFKAVMFKVVTTAVFGAAFGGLSHGVAGFGKHVAMEFIPHVVGETILKGVGKAAIFADTEGEAETDANMIKFAELIAKGIEKMEITSEMMEQMVDSYNEKKVNENIMKNISLKSLIEAEDFQARSKQTGKLVHFKSKDAYQAAIKAGSHEDPKADKGGQSKADTKPNDMFGGDYAKDRGGEAPKVDGMATVNSIAAKTGLRAQAIAGWADENGVNLSNVSADIDSKKLKPMDLMTAISGNPGNKYAKDIISKYSQNGTSDVPKAEKSKYDDKSYWKDDEYSDTQGYIDYDDEDSEEDDDYDEEASDVRLTSDRLSKVETALEDDLDLRGNGFETTRESSGGSGGWEGPMTIVSKDADYNDEDNYISLSVGSPNNDGKFSIVFANSNGEPYFEPNYDALTGDIDLEPQQAYKVTKALMKMPEVQKLLKGEMNREEFQPIYDKLKSKFSKTESTKLTSMIKR